MKKCLKKLSLNKKLFYFPLSPLHISIYLSLSLICFSLSSVTVFLSLSSWLTTIDLTRHRYCRSPHVAANLKRCRPLHSHCHPILSLSCDHHVPLLWKGTFILGWSGWFLASLFLSHTGFRFILSPASWVWVVGLVLLLALGGWLVYKLVRWWLFVGRLSFFFFFAVGLDVTA